MFERNFYDEVEGARFGVNRDFTSSKRFSPRFAAEVEVPTAEARFRAEADAARRLYPEIQALNAMDPNIGKADAAFTREIDALGPSEIENELNRQALSELRLGGDLNAQQIRDSQQSSRAAFAARGLENSTPAAAAEILNRDAYRQALKADRRNFAFAADGFSNGRQQADRSFSLTAMQAARNITDPRAEIFGPGGSAVSGQSGVARIGDMLPFVGAIESQNSAQAFQGHQNNLNRAASVNLAQLGFAHQSSQLTAQQAFQEQQNLLDRQQDREAFNANRSDSLANARANREAASDASRDSTISTAGSALASVGVAAIGAGVGGGGTAALAGVGLVLF